MSGAVEFFKQNPVYLAILAALLALAIWSWYKAAKASAKRNREKEAIMKKLEEDTALRKEFEDLTPEKAQSSDPERLFKGVALGMCRLIEKADDMQQVFDSFTEEQKMIYALYFVFEDGGEKLSDFFRLNGSPLTDYALKAVKTIFGGKAAESFECEYRASDENDETTSFVPAELDKQDAAFAEALSSVNWQSLTADFIKNNIDSLKS